MIPCVSNATPRAFSLSVLVTHTIFPPHTISTHLHPQPKRFFYPMTPSRPIPVPPSQPSAAHPPRVLLDQSDAIFVSDLHPTLHAHSNALGLRHVCTVLSESFHGFPDMLRLLSKWADQCAIDSSQLLRQAVQLTLKNYETTVVTCLDTQLHTQPPPQPVLSALLNHSHWRSVAYSLATNHPESALSFYVSRHRALLNHNLPPVPFPSPRHLVQAILQTLEDTLSATITTTAFTTLFNRIALLATEDEAVALVALSALSHLSRKSPDPITRALVRRATEIVTTKLISLCPPLSPRRRFAVHLSLLAQFPTISATVIDPVLALLAPRGPRRRLDKELATLRITFSRLLGNVSQSFISSDPDIVETITELELPTSDKLALIRALMHPEIISELMQALFANDSSRDPTRRQCLSLLIAYAGVCSALSDAQLEEAVSSEEGKKTLCHEIGTQTAALVTTSELCDQLRPGRPSRVRLLRSLHRHCYRPLVARGTLVWVRDGLLSICDPRNFHITAKRLLSVLEVIARHHILLRSSVLDILLEAFLRDDNALDATVAGDFRDIIIKCTTGLVASHMGTQIVDVFLKHWVTQSRVADEHIRTFISGVLLTVAPPYPKQFSVLFTALLQNNRVAMTVGNDENISKLIMEFRTSVYDCAVTKPGDA